MSQFDKKAKEWDSNRGRIDRARNVAEGILEEIDVTPDMTAFEYGCGTGLLSFQLHEYFKKIIMADNSEGMLEILKKKLEQQGTDNMEARFLDLIKDPLPDEKFDLLYTLMTLHHITELDLIISRFYELLKDGGYLCIADLKKEDGSFHGEGFEGHNGFDRKQLEKLLNKYGFKVVSYKIIFKRKKIIDGEEKEFPIFLLTARR